MDIPDLTGMKLEDLGVLDTSILPFKSHTNDWFTAIIPPNAQERGEDGPPPLIVVYVENALIVRMMKEPGEDVIENPEPLENGAPGWVVNFSVKYRDYGVEAGRSVARFVRGIGGDMKADGMAYEVVFSKAQHRKVVIGFFGGKNFLFLQRRSS